MKQTIKGNNLVYHNVHLGTEKVRSFKSMIQDALYPERPEDFSTGGMALGMKVLATFEKSNAAIKEQVDLMLFYVECGTQFTADYGDIDEDFYMVLEDTFEDTLQLIKKHKLSLEPYKERVDAILKSAEDMGWGYYDQLDDVLRIEFPDLF